LGNVGINPDANVQATILQPLEHACGVGEKALVPFQVGPVELLHPEAVEVKDVQRDVTVGHALHKVGDGDLVVVGGERCGEPQAKRPGGRQRRAAGQRRVAAEHVFGRGAVDQAVIEGFAGHAELDALYFFGANFQRDAFGVVDEDAIAAIGEVEGDVFVGQFTAGAAVFVPQIDDLAVFDEGGEAFAKPVDVLADVEVELFVNVTAVFRIYIPHPSPAALRQQALAVQIIYPPIFAFIHPHCQTSAGEAGEIGFVFDADVGYGLGVQGEGGG